MIGHVKNTGIYWSLFFVLVLTTSVVSAVSRQNQEIFNNLKRLKKPSIKSFKNSDGDIIDCVKLVDQPAFDHPLLKNHTIKLSPTFIPQSRQTDGEGGEAISKLLKLSENCPDDTIPIRRTKRSDILREISLSNKNLSTNDFPLAQRGNEAALGYTNNGRYFGAKALINVWNPHVDNKDEYSKTQIWLSAAKDDVVIDSIEAGWHVSPGINGDSKTRFFVFWTNDGYKSGCYNLQCSGFVQVSKIVSLGGAVEPSSVYGKHPVGFELLIWKDWESGHWWLRSKTEKIGYWPNSLFTVLQNGASVVKWGGAIQNNNVDFKHTTTQMGSGHYAYEGYGKANLMSNIYVVNENNEEVETTVLTKVTRAECYDVKFFPHDPVFKTFFYFGGPGRNDKCQ
ncbi:hypothetical protein ACFE04_009029 [Oxalis oulophora]